VCCAAEAFRADDRLQLLLLKDEAEPGFPSFPVLRTAHLVRFDGRLLPDAFVNQDGDPFLFELYRCMPGAAASSSEVSIVNKRGETLQRNGFSVSAGSVV